MKHGHVGFYFFLFYFILFYFILFYYYYYFWSENVHAVLFDRDGWEERKNTRCHQIQRQNGHQIRTERQVVRTHSLPVAHDPHAPPATRKRECFLHTTEGPDHGPGVLDLLQDGDTQLVEPRVHHPHTPEVPHVPEQVQQHRFALEGGNALSELALFKIQDGTFDETRETEWTVGCGWCCHQAMMTSTVPDPHDRGRDPPRTALGAEAVHTVVLHTVAGTEHVVRAEKNHTVTTSQHPVAAIGTILTLSNFLSRREIDTCHKYF